MCTNRWYYRCNDCLAVVAIEGRLSLLNGNWGPPVGECGACGGTFEEMGRVQGARLTKNEIRCACDARCTHARGPNCDCQCGGENHGTGAVVEVVRDCGPVPRLAVKHEVDGLAARATEWRAARDAVLVRLQSLQSRGWLPEAEYSELCRLRRGLTSARNARSHAGRMKHLRSIAAV